MASTYEPIATTTLSSSASDVTFSSISGSYTDLVLVCQLKSSALAVTYVRFNGDTGSNYSFTNIWGTGSAAYSGRGSNQAFGRITDQAYPDTTLNTITIAHFMNYSNSTTYKTVISRANKAATSDTAAEAVACLWRSTSAITSIQIYPSGGATWSLGSTFTLYGILKA